MKLANDARSGDQLSLPTRHRLSPIGVIGVSVPIHNFPPRSTTGAGPNHGLSLMYRPASFASAGFEPGRGVPEPSRTYAFGPQLASLTPLWFRSNIRVKRRKVG